MNIKYGILISFTFLIAIVVMVTLTFLLFLYLYGNPHETSTDDLPIAEQYVSTQTGLNISGLVKQGKVTVTCQYDKQRDSFNFQIDCRQKLYYPSGRTIDFPWYIEVRHGCIIGIGP